MKRLTPVLLTAALLASLGACKGKSKEQASQPTDKGQEATQTTAEPAPPKQVLNVYSGRTENLVAPVIADFQRESGIEVKVKYADTAQLAATLLEEGARSPADVFLAQDASTLALLEAKGMLAPLPEPITSRVPAAYRSKNGQWVGISGRARVLAYNTTKLKPEDLPKSAAELTSPKWKGRVGWAPENASFQSALSAMIQLEGEDAARKWVKDMQANQPHAYPKNMPALQAVTRGEVDVALVNHYYLYRLRAEQGKDLPADNYYFRNGKAESLVNVSGVAVLTSSKQAQAAERFVEFLLGDKAQSFFVEKNYEFPVVQGMETPLGLPEISTLNTPEVDLTKLEELETTHKILREAGALP